jgi:hypothetical protein
VPGEPTALIAATPKTAIPTGHKVVLAEGADLEGYEIAGEWYIAMRRVCRSLGLDWEGQRQRIVRDPILSKGAFIIQAPSRGGTQETLALRIDLFWGWLFKLDLNRLAPEVRALLIPFQEAGYAALHAHFVGQPHPSSGAMQRAGGADLATSDEDRGALAARLAALEEKVAALAERHARDLNMPPPDIPKPLPPIGRATNIEEISTVEISGLSQPAMILAILRAANGSMQPHEIVDILKRAGMLRTVPNQVGVNLRHMAQIGRIRKVSRGFYAARTEQ